MQRGKVKSIDIQRGYGIILDEKEGKKIFVKLSGLKEKIHQGDWVLYDIIEGRNGWNAINVQLTKR